MFLFSSFLVCAFRLTWRACGRSGRQTRLTSWWVVGTFFGVIFASIEIGLLIGVALSMFKILVLVTRPHLAILGEIPGAAVYRNIQQYKYAKTQEGILALRIDAPILSLRMPTSFGSACSPWRRSTRRKHGIELTVRSAPSLLPLFPCTLPAASLCTASL